MASLKQALARLNTAHTNIDRGLALLRTSGEVSKYAESELLKILGRLEGVIGILSNEEHQSDSIIERGDRGREVERG